MKDDAWTALFLALMVTMPDEFTLKDWEGLVKGARIILEEER